MTESERSCRVRRVVDCNAKAREVNVVTSSNGLGIVSQQTKAYSFDKVSCISCYQSTKLCHYFEIFCQRAHF